MSEAYTSLHEPIEPIIAAALADIGHVGSGVLLDLGCGSGAKLALLLHAAPHMHILAADRDLATLRLHPRYSDRVTCLAADAHRLPLAAGSIAAACCIAALGLFAQPQQVLAEARRAMQPGAPLVLATSAQRWVANYPWPAHVRHTFVRTGRNQSSWRAWPAAHPDIAGDMAALLTAAGFSAPHIRAFPLDSPDPYAAEIELLSPAVLREGGVTASVSAEIEPEFVVRSLALVAIAQA